MVPGFTHLLYPLDRPMTQKYLLAFLAGVLLSLPSIAQTTLKFTDYPVSETYTGKHAKAKTGNGVGQPHPDGGYLPSMFRTRLNEAARSGDVNFAGRYILTTWGCGSGGCREGAIVDAKNGDVFWLPRSACCYDDGDYSYIENSHLLKVVSNEGQELSRDAEEALDKRKQAGEDVPFEDYRAPSVEYFYFFDGVRFQEVFKQTLDKKEADAVEVSVPSELRKYVFDMYEDVAKDVSVINLSDLNADGKNDFILTIVDTGYCGSAGCLTQLLISTKSDRYVAVYSGNLYELKLQPNKSQAPSRFDVMGHSSLCNQNGPDVCEFVLELRGYELELIDWKWTMTNFGKQLMKKFTGN